MVDLYTNNVVPFFKESENELLLNYYNDCIFSIKKYEDKMNTFQITSAFNEIHNIVDNSNKLISTITP